LSDTVIKRVRELVTATGSYMKKWGLSTRCTDAIYSERLTVSCDSPRPGVALFSDGGRIPDESGELISSWESPVIKISKEQEAVLVSSNNDVQQVALVESLIVHELVHYLQVMRVFERENAVMRDAKRIDDADHTHRYFNQRIEIEAMAMQSLHYYQKTDPEKIAGCSTILALRNVFLIERDRDAAIQLGIVEAGNVKG